MEKKDGNMPTVTGASAYRQKKKEFVESRPAEPVTLPSGAVFLLRRADRLAYVVVGSLPRNLTTVAVEAMKKDGLMKEPGKFAPGVEEHLAAAKLTEGEVDDSLQMMARTVLEACVSPRLVVGATGEDELDPSELTDDDFRYIFRWAIGQEGEPKAQTEDGEVPVSSLEKFRKRPARLARTRAAGTQHGAQALGAAGDNGPAVGA